MQDAPFPGRQVEVATAARGDVLCRLQAGGKQDQKEKPELGESSHEAFAKEVTEAPAVVRR